MARTGGGDGGGDKESRKTGEKMAKKVEEVDNKGGKLDAIMKEGKLVSRWER